VQSNEFWLKTKRIMKFNFLIPSSLLILIVLTARLIGAEKDENVAAWKARPCSSLSIGQYVCDKPEIDEETQTERNCSREGRVRVGCYPAVGVVCEDEKFDGQKVGFHMDVECRYVTRYHYKTAVLLSIFLGMFGADRFYLGYMSMGLLKFSTFGFMFIGYLIDMILVITQTLEPIDGSKYIVDYYGQVLRPSSPYNNFTFNVSLN
jgi:TM2 domain-containing membrane protein YozV